MSSTNANNSQHSTKKNFNIPRPIGCCAGQALGCGFSFLTSWVVAWIVSAVLAPLFGGSQGGNTGAGVLLAGLTCGGSLIMGGVLSFLTGRLFPVFKKKAG
ncbi:MAG: hypothetical protein EHM40_16310 [Chloroflexi bacterium]|nr:MAG: hypothetical protein EHM40_16310 [Chloroflexota bacterium]